jgi:5-methylthioadenosine/S-adenosylhomocysteine deaminase
MLDTLLHNATLITMNPDGDTVENASIGIQDCRIVSVDKKAAEAPLPDARETIDVRGGIVMPGLINTHTHLPMSLFRGLADDLPLMTWLNAHIFPAEAQFITPETVYLGTLLSCAELLLSGTTTCCDGYFYELHVAEAVHHAGMRAVLGQGVIDYPAPGVPDPSRNISEAAAFMEAWQEKTPLIQPSVFCHSPYTCSAQTLRAAKALTRSTGALFQIHVAETRSEYDQMRSLHGMTPVAYLNSLKILDSRTLLIHAIWLDDADIAIIARTGAAISHAPESAMKLASGVAKIEAILQAGVAAGLGTDGCASNNNQDMFQEMDMAAKLGKVFSLNPQAMSAQTVLKMATIGAAKATGLDCWIGSIEPGKLADIVILDTHAPHLTPMYHPVSQIVYAANGSDVRDVMIHGNWVVKNRNLISLDLTDILNRIKVESQKIQISDSFVKSSQAGRANPQGVRRTFGYAATTKDAAQRSMRTFYEAVNIGANADETE